MTTVLNRKFDLLCHSGTCPSYLVDVLSLLVAHANDTELFKSELRSGAAPEPASSTSSAAASGPRLSRPSRPDAELSPAERRTERMYRQVEDPDALDAALRASHESVLIAAERSLQTYAEDLKHMNEVAMATYAKQLRTLRVDTQEQMEAFRDRVCASVVAQTRDELDELRTELSAMVKADIAATAQHLHGVSLHAEQQVLELTESYAEYVETLRATTTTATVTGEDTHDAVAHVEERLNGVEATTASLEGLEGRLQELERLVATLGASAQSGGRGSSPVTSSSTVPSARSTLRPAKVTAAVDTNGAPAPAPAKPRTEKPLIQLALSPAAPRQEATKTSPPPSPQQPSLSLADQLGVTVSAGEEGVVVDEVAAGSLAEEHQLGVGHIISHVGRVAVTTPEAFKAAVAATEGQLLKLTTYDPFSGRVRLRSIQGS